MLEGKLASTGFVDKLRAITRDALGLSGKCAKVKAQDGSINIIRI
jgi:hypothetical protein